MPSFARAIRRTALSFGGACAFVAFGAVTAQAGESDLLESVTGLVDETTAPVEDVVRSAVEASAGPPQATDGSSEPAGDGQTEHAAEPGPRTAPVEPEPLPEPSSGGTATGKHARGSEPESTQDEPAESSRQDVDAEPESLLGDLVGGGAATAGRPLGSLTDIARQLARRDPQPDPESAPDNTPAADEASDDVGTEAEPEPTGDAPDAPEAPSDDPAANTADGSRAGQAAEPEPGVVGELVHSVAPGLASDPSEQTTNLVGEVSSTLTPLITTVTEPLLTTTTAPLNDAVDSTAGSLLSPVTEPVGAVAEPVGALLAPVTPAVAPILEAVTTTGTPVLAPVTETVGTLAAPLAPALDPVLTGIAPLLGPVIESLEPVTTGLAPVTGPLTDALDPVVDVLDQLVGPLVDPLNDEVLQPALVDLGLSPTGNDTAWGLSASNAVAAFLPASAGENPAVTPASLTGLTPAGADVSSNIVIPTTAGVALVGSGHGAPPAVGSASAGQGGDGSSGSSGDMHAAAVLLIGSTFLRRERCGVAALAAGLRQPGVRPD